MPVLIAHAASGSADAYNNASYGRGSEKEIPVFFMLRRPLLVAWISSHWRTDLAKSMGLNYTNAAANLCKDYMFKFSGLWRWFIQPSFCVTDH
jgi:hypothetical protein